MPGHQEKGPQIVESMSDFVTFLTSQADFVDGPELPVPTIGKMPESGTGPMLLPTELESEKNVSNTFFLSWNDEEDLGIRVQVCAVPSAQGLELKATAVGLRPDFVNGTLSLGIFGKIPGRIKNIELTLNGPPVGDAVCSGEASFGLVGYLRSRLGEAISLDVFRLN